MCGFKAKVGDRDYPFIHFSTHFLFDRQRLLGIVKEKYQAFEEYEQAISEGHGAFVVEKGTPFSHFHLAFLFIL